MHRGQRHLRRELVAHHHGRQITLIFNAGVKRQLRTQQYHAVNLARQHQVKEGFLLLILMRAVTNQHQIAFLRGGHFHAADNLAEERVTDVRHNHQNGLRVAAFGVARQTVRRIADRLHRLFHFLPGRGGDFFRIHQRARNRGGGDASLLGHIFHGGCR